MLSSRSNLAVRPRQAHNSAFRQARTQRLNISAATLWSVQHKGKEYDLTDAVGKHKICTIKGKEANDCQKALQEVEGVDIVFEASGESDPVDSPSDLSLKVDADQLLVWAFAAHSLHTNCIGRSPWTAEACLCAGPLLHRCCASCGPRNANSCPLAQPGAAQCGAGSHSGGPACLYRLFQYRQPTCAVQLPGCPKPAHVHYHCYTVPGHGGFYPTTSNVVHSSSSHVPFRCRCWHML